MDETVLGAAKSLSFKLKDVEYGHVITKIYLQIVLWFKFHLEDKIRLFILIIYFYIITTEFLLLKKAI